MPSASSSSAVITQDRLLQATNYADVSALALWIYDYLQTLHFEITLVWLAGNHRKRISLTSALFLLNRYVFPLSMVLLVIMAGPGRIDESSCSALGTTYYILVPITLVTSSALLIVRVYALYGRRKSILAVSGVITAARLALDIVCGQFWQTTTSTIGTSYAPFSRCRGAIKTDVTTRYQNAQIANVVLALIFDLGVSVLTLSKTYRHAMAMRRNGGISVTNIMLRDGVICFLIMLLIAIISVVAVILPTTSSKGLSSTGSTFLTLLSPFLATLPNIAINRLFLNLRSFRPDSSTSTSSNSETVTGFECYPRTHTELSTMSRSPRRPGKKLRRVSAIEFARAPSAWVGSMSMSRGMGTSGTIVDIEA